MASVFLSYDHEDADRAAPIVAALEEAGHSVWWDRHIAGGSEYNTEIEREVERSDVVAVLWSERSVRSAWVRDEAAEGRDQGKLVPLRIDPIKPPMGFRQYQNIDLTDWTGRGKPPRLPEILAAIDRVAGGRSSSPSTIAGPETTRKILSANAPPILLTALAFAAAATLLVLRPWQNEALPLVSVEPADESNSAKILASDLLIKLGSLQTAEANALRLVEPESDAEPDFTFKVATLAASGGTQANLALVDGDGGLLWSREFTQPSGNQADLRQQVAYSAGQVLRCATEALAPDHPKLDASVLGLYLNGCADLSAASDTRMAISTFRRVTEEAPRFAGGWGKLLIAELEAFKATGANDLQLQDDLRRHVAEAKKVNPELAENYLVQSWLQKPRPILGWMRFADEALKKKPDNAAILENHAIGLGHVGLLREATENAKRASEIEPLSPSARQTLIEFLGDSGAYQAAQRELDEAERLWPGASNILQARFWFEFRHGNPKKALNLIESSGLAFLPSPAQTSYLRARIDGSPASIEAAIADARKAYQAGHIYQLVQTLAAFRRKDEAIELLLSSDPQRSHGIISTFFRRPALREIRRDPRFMEIARRYGLVDYWTATGRWPDYCFEPDLPYDCRKEAAKAGRRAAPA